MALETREQKEITTEQKGTKRKVNIIAFTL